LHTAETIAQHLTEFIATHPDNRPAPLGGTSIYAAPLVGIASAADPLWNELRQEHVVGPQQLLPGEWLPGARSVVCYFLPFSEHVRESNRTAGDPSLEWLVGRFEGEAWNGKIRRRLIEMLEKSGARAVAPSQDPRLAVANFRSNWSERHAAFIAGLGTFGLSRSLITAQGCAGRLGSAILDLELAPTPRPYQRHDDYCMNCGYCIPRCPPRAISIECGKDNAVCKRFLDAVKGRHEPRYGCGKCQTGVPCEAVNPMQR
jgi:epoxyqueuosine reductase QueG